jgi:hypothetical protein
VKPDRGRRQRPPQSLGPLMDWLGRYAWHDIGLKVRDIHSDTKGEWLRVFREVIHIKSSSAAIRRLLQGCFICSMRPGID